VSSRNKTLGVASMCLVLAALAFPGIAGAWVTSFPSPYVVRIERSSGDAAGNVQYYAGYMTAQPTGTQSSTGSWESTASGGYFQGVNASTVLFDSNDWVYERTFPVGVTMVLVTTPAGDQMLCSNPRYPSPVVLTDPGTYVQANTVGIASSMNTVRTTGATITATLSETLTVDPWSTAGLPSGWVMVFVVMTLASVGSAIGLRLARTAGKGMAG